MKPTAYLVNVAGDRLWISKRRPALAEGHIAGAGLDVFERGARGPRRPDPARTTIVAPHAVLTDECFRGNGESAAGASWKWPRACPGTRGQSGSRERTWLQKKLRRLADNDIREELFHERGHGFAPRLSRWRASCFAAPGGSRAQPAEKRRFVISLP
jgi:hypothetical protein